MKYIISIVVIFINTHAKSQLKTHGFSDLLLNYEFTIWSSSNDSLIFNTLIKKASLYTNERLYNSALSQLERADVFCKSSIHNTILRYEKLKVYFFASKYNYVVDIFLSEDELQSINKSSEYTKMKLFALNEQEKWSDCKSLLITYCKNCDSSLINMIKELPVKYEYKSPEKCKRQSAFLPGLGQTTAGYPFKGITSLSIQAGLITFVAYNIHVGFYIAGVVSGVIPLLKFYAGGKRLSSILAEKENEKKSSIVKSKYTYAIKNVLN